MDTATLLQVRSFDESGLREAGFQGFVTFAELLNGGLAEVPAEPGAYVVVAPGGGPVFLDVSVGGHFKGRNPTVDVSTLENAWVEDAGVIYVGKANVLRRRLTEYAKFGAGVAIGHYGGRYVWQLKGSSELCVAWLPTPGEDPRDVEVEILATFARQHDGVRPFANLVG